MDAYIYECPKCGYRFATFFINADIEYCCPYHADTGMRLIGKAGPEDGVNVPIVRIKRQAGGTENETIIYK